MVDLDFQGIDSRFSKNLQLKRVSDLPETVFQVYVARPISDSISDTKYEEQLTERKHIPIGMVGCIHVHHKKQPNIEVFVTKSQR